MWRTKTSTTKPVGLEELELYGEPPGMGLCYEDPVEKQKNRGFHGIVM